MANSVSEQTILRQKVIQVGKVATLSRYPVKSMGADALTEARVGLMGVEGDRRYAFIQSRNHSNFPWLTAREIPRMLLYKATLTDPSTPDNSGIIVTTPEGEELDIFSDELNENLRAKLRERERDQPIYAVHLQHTFDEGHLSLVTTYALQKLSGLVGSEVEPRCFRENLIVDTNGSEQPDEQTWIGSQVIIGEGEDATVVGISSGDPRCMMPNLHPDTAQQDPRILRAIAQHQGNLMGVYATVLKTGIIRVGDTVRLVSTIEE